MNIDVFSFSFFKDLNMEFNPSDHPRASTIFLSKSQTDGRLLIYLCFLGGKKAHVGNLSLDFLLDVILKVKIESPLVIPKVCCLMVFSGVSFFCSKLRF